MKYILFIILILSLIALYFYYEKKLELMRKQLMITSHQYNNIRNKYDVPKKANNNLSIRFITPSYKTGIINTDSKLYIAPLDSSQIIRKTNIRMEVSVLDSAESNNQTWYYVNLPIDNCINCRGWINSKDVSMFYSESASISKSN
ncbi:hypothetical protein ABHA07_17290 [Clostridium tertium]|uniref:hypothetical protein n=1 Tax=Clostridium tertium TaxID=1559 RepID=UPI0023310053|nr:hypothetical protein [Clostridium tertium]MDB1942381.1 hypothetical protein [Clostridium tertium]